MHASVWRRTSLHIFELAFTGHVKPSFPAAGRRASAWRSLKGYDVRKMPCVYSKTDAVRLALEDTISDLWAEVSCLDLTKGGARAPLSLAEFLLIFL